MSVAVPDKLLHAAQDLARGAPGGAFTMEDVERIASLARISPIELVELAILLKEEGLQGDGTVFQGVCTWLERNYYIAENQGPISLFPHQRAILNYIFPFSNCTTWDEVAFLDEFWTQVVYSTIKKSGKTELTSGVARWVAEQWKPWPLVLTGANDLTQARTRIYQQIGISLELMPGWDPKKRHVIGPDGTMTWNVTEEALLYLPNHAKVLALSSDFRGEAGANPTATFFSELWGFTLDKLKKLWAEMVPVATRVGSFRWAETYAGYKNERGPLNDLYDGAVKRGEQLNCHTMPEWPTPQVDCNCYNTHGCCPEHDTADNRLEGFGYPMYINRKEGLVAYWDMGVRARRLPWQTERYYSIQRELFKKDEPGYERLHENRWTESIDAYIPISWWDNNEDDDIRAAMLLDPLTYGVLPGEPVVLGADAAVSSDCCALSMVTRHPKRPQHAALRACWIWYPPTGGVFNYQDTLEKKIRQLCGCIFDYKSPEQGHSRCRHRKAFNVVNLSYDKYQLHDMMQRISRDGLVWCYDFSQGDERGKADKQLIDIVREREFGHPGGMLMANDGFGPPDGLVVLREHLEGADKKTAVDDNTKVRIIKRNDDTKIDGAVATSMAAYTCKRLNIEQTTAKAA